MELLTLIQKLQDIHLKLGNVETNVTDMDCDSGVVKLQVQQTANVIIDLDDNEFRDISSDLPINYLLIDPSNQEKVWKKVEPDYKRVLKLIEDPYEESEGISVLVRTNLPNLTGYEGSKYGFVADMLRSLTKQGYTGSSFNDDNDTAVFTYGSNRQELLKIFKEKAPKDFILEIY